MCHYRQHIQERSRGHGKTGIVPFNQPVQRREGTQKVEKKTRKRQKNDTEGRCNSISVFFGCIPTAEKAKTSGHTVRGPGMGVAGLFCGASRTANLIP